MSTLHVRLLGDFQTIYDEVELTNLNSPRLQTLLSYLVLHRGMPQARHHLAFLLWPDSSETRARTSLRNLFHTLRHTLPEADQFLRADASTLEWRADAPLTLDVTEFEQAITQAQQTGDDEEARSALERASELYRGDLLPSCYDDWIISERERLCQLHIHALERLIAQLEEQHDSRAALRYAQRLLQADPLREDTYRLLMRLHALSGDRVGVLRTYQTCAAVLKRELDVDPSAATREASARYSQVVMPEASPSTSKPPAQARAPGAPNNLPSALTSFIGRERETAEVKHCLANTRLLTLTGTGGSGKTRLALHVAHELLAARAFADGVWWVELAALTDESLVHKAVASALVVAEQPGRSLLETLTWTLRHKHLLLVLDNCEHLMDACVQLVHSLLSAAPDLRIVATSREVLNVTGETTWLVPSLACPTSDLRRPASVDEIGQYEAVRLFVERAASVLPTFKLTTQNAPVVAEICRRLDSIPLAIELAAARVKVLSVEQIAQRLEQRFSLLTAGGRAALPRHQSLRAAMDWGYELLSEPERVLFRRLSVFAGGFTLEAAEAVCQSDGRLDVLNGLALLVDKSLVQQSEAKPGPRFTLLETIRAYARERFIDSGEEELILTRHLDYFLRLAEEAEPQLRGAEQVAWLNRLEQEHDNLRAVLQWALGRAEIEPALRMGGALGLFWLLHGHETEGRRWIEAGLDKAGDSPTPARVQALLKVARLVSNQGDYAQARRFYEKSLALGRELVEVRSIAEALSRLGHLDSLQGGHQSAHRRLEESLGLWRKLEDRLGIATTLFSLGIATLVEGDYTAEWLEESLKLFRELDVKDMIAIVLNGLGEKARAQEDYERAAAFYRESIVLSEELGHKLNMAHLLSNLGYIALQQNDKTQAAALFRESLMLFQELGGSQGVPECLAGSAGVMSAAGWVSQAVRLLGAAAALRDAIGSVWWPADQRAYDQTLSALRARLDETSFTSAWAEGRALTLEQAVDDARQLLQTLSGEAAWI